MSPDWKQLYEEINSIYEIYESTTHPRSMKDLIFTRNHTIEKIVIMGLGDNWWRLAMILGLKQHFLDQTPQKANIDVFSQEHYDKVPKGTKSNSLYPDTAAGRAAYSEDCILALEKHFIKLCDHMKQPSRSPGPVVNEITSRTLLFTPFLHMEIVAKALQGRDPELYIGAPMECVENRCEKKGKSELKDVARDFREKHEWKRLEALPGVVYKNVKMEEVDKMTGQFENMYIYRRRSVGIKKYEGPASNDGWSREAISLKLDGLPY